MSKMCNKPGSAYPIAAALDAVREALSTSEFLTAVEASAKAFEDDSRYRDLVCAFLGLRFAGCLGSAATIAT